MKLNHIIPLAAALSIAAAPFAYADAADTSSARKSPLEWAKILVREIAPENTSYRHKQGYVRWKGIGGAQAYESHTDCSGFLNALLERADGFGREDFKKWLGKGRPFAITYHDAIVKLNRFTPIERVDEIRPGDVIAIKYPDGSANTGHVMLIADFPQKHKSSKPVVDMTEQWEVKVIDSSQSGHGKTDTRRRVDGTFGSGVGQGSLRLYAAPQGNIAGYTWSTAANSEYYDQAQRHLVIGRLDILAGH